MKIIRPFIVLLIVIQSISLWSQGTSNTGEDRLEVLKQKLDQLAEESKGLNQKVDFSVTGITIQEFLRGLAESNELNISIDPSINVRVYNNFNNVEAKNILLFLCKEYDLDIRFVGSIMSFYPYRAPIVAPAPIQPKEIDVKYFKEKDVLSLNLRKDSLFKVLTVITQATGKNVISAPDVSNDLPLSAFIKEMPFKSAIEKMAFSNNLELEITEDSFYVLKPKPKELISTDESKNSRTNGRNNGRSNSSNNRNSYSSKPSSGEYFLEIKDSLGTRFVSFSTLEMDISDIIREVSSQAEQNYFMFSEPKGTVNLTVNDVLYDDFLEFVLLGSDFTYKIEDGVYLIGDRKAEGLRETKVMQLVYRTYADIESVIPAELKQGVEIQEFPELNSFVVSGSAPQIAEIEQLVTVLDQVVPLIMIEVILVDVRKGKVLTTGVKAGLADTTSGGTLLPGLDLILSSATLNKILSPLNLGKVNKNFYIGLSALDAQDYADVKSMPKLATLNGHEANMTIGETRYYLTETQNVVGSLNANTVVTQQWNSVEANLSVQITPQVSGDEYVTLDINIEVSDFVGDPPPNAPPPSSTRQFTSLIRVKDHEMVLLGGMERESKSESGSGFPVLSRIPVIKWFFSSKSKSKSKSISFVFIKPTIIY